MCCFQCGGVHWDINMFGDKDDGRMAVELQGMGQHIGGDNLFRCVHLMVDDT